LAGLLQRIGSYFSNPIVDRNYYRPEKRSAQYYNSSDAQVVEFFGGGHKSKAGVVVTEETAMRLSVVYACTNILGESIASLPVSVYKSTGEGSEEATKHWVHWLLHYEPNAHMTSFTFRHTLQTHAALYGNAYARIIRNGGARPISLKILSPLDCRPYLDEVTDTLWYKHKGETIPAQDILHIPALSFDGILGKSPIRTAMDNIGLAMAAQEFGATFFGNGAHLGGVLQRPVGAPKLEGPATKAMLDSWNNNYSGPANNHKTALLQEGTEYHRIGIPPEEAQFIETRKFQVAEICRIFRIPPHMVQDLERSTNNNIEHQGIEFVVHTLRPWLKRWEEELNRKLFREDEKGKFYVKFNLDGLLRGDSKARGELYRTLFNTGAISPNEIRAMENMNAVEGGEQRFVQINMAPIDKIEELLMAKNTQNTNSDSNGEGNQEPT
jgi:HK97 family phage portal protein